MAERVLLTGGSGFFGRRIAEALRRHGYDVLTPGRPEFDLMDASMTRRTIERLRPDTIVHSAAYYGGLGICMAEPAQIFQRNVVMGVNVLEAAAKAGVGKVMAIGSACSYPGGVAGDMREDDFWSGPLHPSVESYGFTKKVPGGRPPRLRSRVRDRRPDADRHEPLRRARRLRRISIARRRRADQEVRRCRPGRADKVVCWGTGAPVREFIYSGDAAEAVARLLASGYTEPLNIGTGIGTSIKELAELTARLTGFRGEIVWDTTKADGVLRKVLDVSKMEGVLNWKPPTSLEAGLRRTIRWYLENKAEADARP